MPRFQRPKRRDRQRRELVAGIGLLALLGGLLAGGLLWNTLRIGSNVSAARGTAPIEQDLRTGPILFVPVAGNVCRQRLIDNETWRIRDAGHVICDEAVSWNASVPLNTYSVITRVQALRTVFSARQGP